MTQEFYSHYLINEDLRKRHLDMRSVRKYSTHAPFLKRLLKCNPTPEKEAILKAHNQLQNCRPGTYIILITQNHPNKFNNRKIKSSKAQMLYHKRVSEDAKIN